MGKGQRNRELRAAEKEANREILVKKIKKDRTKKWVISIISVVLVISLVGGLMIHFIGGSITSSGKNMRKAIALQTKNYAVNAAMMSYFFYTQYNQIVNDYNSYLEYISLDTSKSLKSQQCGFADEGTTWYDYFVDQAATQVKEMLYLAENAKAEGMKLDKKDEEVIKENMASYEEAAKSNKLSLKEFIPAVFGTGVSEDDVRDCIELSMMAQKYLDKFQNSLEYSDNEINAFYAENIDSYRYVDYYNYAISASDRENKATYSDAKKKAEELAKVESTKAFREWVEKHERANAKITKDYTKEAFEADLSDTLDGLSYVGATYNKDDKASEWLFNKAKVGETNIADDGKGSYTVYYCTAVPYRDEEITRTIRQIVILEENHNSKEEAKTAANDIINEMAGKALTEEIFTDKVYQYSEDSNTAPIGGICENYPKSSFESKIGEWVFHKDRNPGDMEMVEMEGGYAICYYVGEGLKGWQASCITAMESEDYEEAKSDWEMKYPITETKKSYDLIPDIL